MYIKDLFTLYDTEIEAILRFTDLVPGAKERETAALVLEEILLDYLDRWYTELLYDSEPIHNYYPARIYLEGFHQITEALHDEMD
jgi:hypothetical protein